MIPVAVLAILLEDCMIPSFRRPAHKMVYSLAAYYDFFYWIKGLL